MAARISAIRKGGGAEGSKGTGAAAVALLLPLPLAGRGMAIFPFRERIGGNGKWPFFFDLVFVVDRKLEERKRVNEKWGKDGDYKKGQCSLVSLLTKDKATHPSLCPSSSHYPKNNIYNKITLLVLVLLGFPKTSLRMVSSVLNLNYVCF